jgi:methylenetetrahydrofolate reductase (NADPH)
MQFSIEVTSNTTLVPLPSAVQEVSITYLPGADDQDIISQSQRVQALGYQPIPHIPARSMRDRAHLESFLTRLRDTVDLKKVLVIGGSRDAIGDYTSTLQLLETGLFEGLQVGIAGHPEGMPQLCDDDCDAVLYAKNQFARATGQQLFIVTQWVMRPQAVLDWLDRIQSFNTLPIYLGIPGPASVQTLMKFAGICGVRASLTGLKHQSGKLGQLLMAQTPDAIVDALHHRVDHFHLYTFGGVKQTAAWISDRTCSSLTA